MDEAPSIQEIRQAPIFSSFAACFRKILAELADWPPERADGRLERWLKNSGFRAYFGHDSPAYFAASELISDEIARRPGVDLVRLRQRIIAAIERDGNPEDPFFPHEDPNYDWRAAHQRVAAILREYQSDSN